MSDDFANLTIDMSEELETSLCVLLEDWVATNLEPASVSLFNDRAGDIGIDLNELQHAVGEAIVNQILTQAITAHLEENKQ